MKAAGDRTRRLAARVPGRRHDWIVAGIVVITMLVTDAKAAQAPSEAIVVTGTRRSAAVLHAEANAYVRATGIAAGAIPAARWLEPVCPRVIGLTDEATRAVDTKLRQVAADGRVPVAPVPCRANIAVVFALNGGAVVRRIVSRSPRRLTGVPPATVAALTRGTAPIRWWYATGIRDKDGVAATATSPLGLGFGGMNPDNEKLSFVQHESSSIVGTGDVRALRSATVVVDVARTTGLPLDAVASYAAMVALAELRLGADPVDSILHMFAGGAALRSPSTWDMALLRALYRLPLDRDARSQRGLLTVDLVAAAG